MLKTNKRYFLKGITLLYIEEIKETTDVEDDWTSCIIDIRSNEVNQIALLSTRQVSKHVDSGSSWFISLNLDILTIENLFYLIRLQL